MRSRTRLFLSATLLVAGPIAASVWHVHRKPERAFALVTAHASTPRTVDSIDTSDTPSARVSHYLAERNTLVDALLPEGEGGTQFYVRLDTNSGMAFPNRAAIGITADARSLADGERVELHERAHLLHAFAGGAVDSLLMLVGPAAPGLYAATNPEEHFGEMAAMAWSVLVEPRGLCSEIGTLEMLRTAERDVPGTAGFVEWYLRDPRMLPTETREALRAEALRLSAPQRAAWEDVWRAVESRRNPDGTFTRWRTMTTREDLESVRARMAASRSRLERIVAVALLPSLAVVSVLQ